MTCVLSVTRAVPMTDQLVRVEVELRIPDFDDGNGRERFGGNFTRPLVLTYQIV